MPDQTRYAQAHSPRVPVIEKGDVRRAGAFVTHQQRMPMTERDGYELGMLVQVEALEEHARCREEPAVSGIGTGGDLALGHAEKACPTKVNATRPRSGLKVTLLSKARGTVLTNARSRAIGRSATEHVPLPAAQIERSDRILAGQPGSSTDGRSQSRCIRNNW